MKNNQVISEKEILEGVDLCNKSGALNPRSIGWARKPMVNCNLSGHWLRKKKWNYWGITSPECLFSVTIANLDYMGLVSIYFLDFKTKQFIEKSVMTPFGKGCAMPQVVHETVLFDHSKMSVAMIQEKGYTHIVAACKNFNGVAMKADLKLFSPIGHETLNVVVPWNEKQFQFTSKQECLPVDGWVQIGDQVYQCQPEESFACLDFGRGIWPYRVKWNWASASGIVNNRSVGLNLGGKWTDGTGSNENCLVVDGKIVKLSEDVLFEYDQRNFMKQWKIKTSISSRVDITFTPFYERISKVNLFILMSEVHQLIGYFSGSITTDRNEIIIIDQLLGWVEEHSGKW